MCVCVCVSVCVFEREGGITGALTRYRQAKKKSEYILLILLSVEIS